MRFLSVIASIAISATASNSEPIVLSECNGIWALVEYHDYPYREFGDLCISRDFSQIIGKYTLSGFEISEESRDFKIFTIPNSGDRFWDDYSITVGEVLALDFHEGYDLGDDSLEISVLSKNGVIAGHTYEKLHDGSALSGNYEVWISGNVNGESIASEINYFIFRGEISLTAGSGRAELIDSFDSDSKDGSAQVDISLLSDGTISGKLLGQTFSPKINPKGEEWKSLSFESNYVYGRVLGSNAPIIRGFSMASGSYLSAESSEKDTNFAITITMYPK